MNPQLIGLLVALGVALVATVTDIRERRIPNVLILVGLVIASAIAAISGRWLDGLVGGGLGMAVLALPRLVAPDSAGLGDIKLVGVIGLGAGTVGIVAIVGLAVAAATPVALWTVRSRGVFRPVPFAPFLALGVVGRLASHLAVGTG